MAFQHQTTQRGPTQEHFGYACKFQTQKKYTLQMPILYFHPFISYLFNATLQDPQMLDQLAKNITRCGLSNSTLNYLRVSNSSYDYLLLLSNWIHLNYTCNLPNVSPPLFCLPEAMCDIGAHARADVQA